jgi:hypothetical protein
MTPLNQPNETELICLDLILAGVVPALLAAATAWRFRIESAGATANQ